MTQNHLSDNLAWDVKNQDSAELFPEAVAAIVSFECRNDNSAHDSRSAGNSQQ